VRDGRTTKLPFRASWQSLRLRLVSVIVIPVLLAVGMSTLVAGDRITAAQHAEQAGKKAKVLQRVIDLRQDLQIERFDALALTIAPPVDGAKAENAFRAAMMSPLNAARQTTDMALTQLEPDIAGTSLAGVGTQLTALREQFDLTSLSSEQVLQQYTTVINQLSMASTTEINEMYQSLPAGVGGVRQLASRLQLLSTADSLSSTEQSLSLMVLEAWWATPAQKVGIRDNMAVTRPSATQQKAALSALAPPSLQRTWASLEADPTEQFWISQVNALANLSTTAQGPPPGPDQLPGLLRASELSGGFSKVQHGAVDLVLSSSQAVEYSAQREMWLTLAGAALLMVTALLIGAAVLRRVRQPLEDLASRARRITEGRLEIGHEGGAREIAVVAEALNETIHNLEQIGAQTAALGRGELEDDCFTKQIPGALGESIALSVAQLAKLQERLLSEATHDPLTGLLNRRAAVAALAEVLDHGADGPGAAVVFLDLDDRKRANNNNGHNAGVEVLRICAQRLASCVGEADTLYRFGGDEFIVISTPARPLDDLIDLGSRLIAKVCEPITIEGRTINLSASVGVASSVAVPGTSWHESDVVAMAEELLSFADMAASLANTKGSNRVEPFEASVLARRVEDKGMEADLRAALAADAFELHFQPVLSTHLQATKDVEALLRWQRPGYGSVGPDLFIPVAERSDLIVDIDRWVLRAACRQLASWNGDERLGKISMAVNISGRHLGRGLLVDSVMSAVREFQVDPGHLSVEITETVILGHVAVATNELRQLQSYGVRVALDDFGTGYTSISQLSQLPVDVLKIDRSMLPDSDADANRLALLELTVAVGHRLGMEVTAEGVETPYHLQLMRQLGCDWCQGFLFSKALSAAEVTDWLLAGPRREPALHEASIAG
jgi:diguanylate cyclase (GGDEF)-like protein